MMLFLFKRFIVVRLIFLRLLDGFTTLISFSILFLIVILCCCSRIRLAVAVCKCAAHFVTQVCLVILVPVFQTLLAIVLWVTTLVVLVYLISATKFTA